MKHTLINNPVLDALKELPDESVDCIVSSPPYYGLRSYSDADTIWGDWKGQLGLEPTYQMYIAHLMLVMKELKRILKKTGTLWWNMGDSYASSGSSNRHSGYPDPKWDKARNGSFEEPTAFDQGIKPKSLMMIPERFAIAMIDDGWILRNKIVWYKRNGMPSSIKDRFSNKWEYVFFFTKSQKYYFDLDSIRKPLAESSIKRIPQKNIPNQFKSGKSAEFALAEPVNNIPKIINSMHKKYDGIYSKLIPEEFENDEDPHHPKGDPTIHGMRLPPQPTQKGAFNPKGANPGDVINIPAVRHKSLASNPGHKFTHERKYDPDADGGDFLDIPTRPHKFAHFAVFPETLVEPLIKVGCSEGQVVLDPFAGSGTVGVVAQKLGRSSMLIEISPEYCKIIKERLNWDMGLDIEYKECY